MVLPSKNAEKKVVRLTQAELDKIIAKHELFRHGATGGARASLAHHDLSKLSLRGKDMSHADFTSAALVDTDFMKSKLDYCQFFAADCRNANFREASMVRADLRGACLRGAVMSNADLTDADMREGSFAFYDPEKGLSFASDNPEWKEGSGGVDMRGATLSSAKLSGAIATNSNFSDANLSKVTFARGDLSGANLSGANLVGADMSSCVLKNVNLRGANLVGVKMDVSGLVNVDMSGALTDKPMGMTIAELKIPLEELVGAHKLWLESKGANGQRMDLQGYDLRSIPHFGRVDLTMFLAEESVWQGFDFSRMNIQASRFGKSDLRACSFDAADMRGSHFHKTNMVGSKLRKAFLNPLMLEGSNRILKSNFSEANLRYADFTGANLREVDFSGADISFADFSGADITGADFHDAVTENAKIDLGKAKK